MKLFELLLYIIKEIDKQVNPGAKAVTKLVMGSCIYKCVSILKFSHFAKIKTKLHRKFF